jgi:hypothetical protein
MHSGESTTRFFKVTPRIVNGEKSWGVALMAGTFWSDGLASGKYLSGGF